MAGRKISVIPRWTVGRARQNFAGLLKAAERAPQEIYHRNRLRAIVVRPDAVRGEGAVPAASKPRNIAEAFAELRQIARETGYIFPQLPKRRDRPNALLQVLSRRAR